VGEQRRQAPVLGAEAAAAGVLREQKRHRLHCADSNAETRASSPQSARAARCGCRSCETPVGMDCRRNGPDSLNAQASRGMISHASRDDTTVDDASAEA
jgi:hypothetical protein